jgi:geranylgeranyl transferase type-2 subunit beta
MQPYLATLAGRLAEGLSRLPDAFRARHVAYLHGRQNADGGFPGREGGSDLYYTSFALRALAALDALEPERLERAAGYLRGCLTRPASVIDLFSLLYSCLIVQAGGGPDVLADSPPDWPERVVEALERFGTADGGYGKTAGAASGSTYHTFLVGLAYQLLNRPLPRPDEAVRFVRGRQRDDGGFVEIAPMKRSGTNPTAAAVGLLQLVADSGGRPLAEILPPETAARVINFLAGMPSQEGGLRANDRVPLADLLSTFTGCWTLWQLGGQQRVDRAEIRGFVESLELATGGFRAGLWDDQADVEYTFYGLGTMALVT